MRIWSYFYFIFILTHLYSDGSYPTVNSYSAGEWSIDESGWHASSSSNSLSWSIPVITANTKSGSLEFSFEGDDEKAFFPVDISFVCQGSLTGVAVASVSKVDGAQVPEYSVDAFVTADKYLIV